MTIDRSRRRFLRTGIALPIASAFSAASVGAALVAFAAAPAADPYRKLLVLVELNGGNDGLNTVVPYADSAYYALRPKLATARDHVVQLPERVGWHSPTAP